jgi:hypothetical protein
MVKRSFLFLFCILYLLFVISLDYSFGCYIYTVVGLMFSCLININPPGSITRSSAVQRIGECMICASPRTFQLGSLY